MLQGKYVSDNSVQGAYIQVTYTGLLLGFPPFSKTLSYRVFRIYGVDSPA
jgi:hypothetical protein